MLSASGGCLTPVLSRHLSTAQTRMLKYCMVNLQKALLFITFIDFCLPYIDNLDNVKDFLSLTSMNKLLWQFVVITTSRGEWWHAQWRHDAAAFTLTSTSVTRD